MSGNNSEELDIVDFDDTAAIPQLAVPVSEMEPVEGNGIINLDDTRQLEQPENDGLINSGDTRQTEPAERDGLLDFDDTTQIALPEIDTAPANDMTAGSGDMPLQQLTDIEGTGIINFDDTTNISLPESVAPAAAEAKPAAEENIPATAEKPSRKKPDRRKLAATLLRFVEVAAALVVLALGWNVTESMRVQEAAEALAAASVSENEPDEDMLALAEEEELPDDSSNEPVVPEVEEEEEEEEEKVVYEKIDVKKDIKKESEINVSAEDTKAVNAAAATEQPVLPVVEPAAAADTVEWVESSVRPKDGSTGYALVSRDDIPEPAYAGNAGVYANTQLAAVSARRGRKTLLRSDEDNTAEDTEEETTEEETETTPTPTPEDTKDPKNDSSTKLTDKNGNQVYVKSGEDYKEAVYADYYSGTEFYITAEIEYIYTGWQTIGGNTYFYTKDGVPVTGDQVIQGTSYHFNEDGVLQDNDGSVPIEEPGNTGGVVLGIDVSKWNGSIDWTAVKNSGVSFVIVRCGYRGSASGVLVEDPTFRSNVQGATAAGLKVGLYFFTQAVNEQEAVEEASMCLSLAAGYAISYPIFIDTEFTSSRNGRADKLDRATRTAVCRAFCETVRNGGYAAGVYSSKTWLGPMVDIGSIPGARVWLAHYTAQTDYAGHYDIWQYSKSGAVAGIKGAVDLNYSYMGY